MRTSLSLTCLVLLSGGFALGAGCVAGEPSANIKTYGDGGASADLGPAPSPDLLPPDDGEIDPPVLDTIEQVTEYSTVPIHGVAEPSSTVLLRYMDGSRVAIDVSSTGRFCVDAPLASGKTNTFDVVARDINGNESDSVPISVRQEGSPAQAPPPSAPTNAAYAGTATSYRIGIFSSGPGDNAVDNSLGTAIEGHYLAGWSLSQPDPMVIAKFRYPQRINKIRAMAASSCLFEATVDLYYSAADAPSPPDVQPMAWIKVPATKNAGKTEVNATMESVIASHVAAVWPKQQSGDLGDNCGWDSRTYGLAELQAWTVPNQPPPPPRAPTCVGGAL